MNNLIKYIVKVYIKQLKRPWIWKSTPSVVIQMYSVTGMWSFLGFQKILSKC